MLVSTGVKCFLFLYYRRTYLRILSFLLISYFHMLLTDHLLPMTIGYIFQRVYRHFFPSNTFSQDICTFFFLFQPHGAYRPFTSLVPCSNFLDFQYIYVKAYRRSTDVGYCQSSSSTIRYSTNNLCLEILPGINIYSPSVNADDIESRSQFQSWPTICWQTTATIASLDRISAIFWLDAVYFGHIKQTSECSRLLASKITSSWVLSMHGAQKKQVSYPS